MRRSPVRRYDSERGAVAVTTLILLTVLLALMAFVVDLGFIRADVRESQTAADSAAVAASGVFSDGGSFEEACQTAVDYLEVNLDIVLPADTCDPFANGVFITASIDCALRAGSTLDPTQNPVVIAPVYVERQDTVAGDHTVRIQMPVRHADDPGATVTDEAMGDQTYESSFDGTDPCSRIAVSVRRSRDSIFGTFAGSAAPKSGFADAVSLFRIDEGDKIVPSLVVLDPTGCVTINARSNDDSLLVGSDDNSPPKPGVITVDSDGTECDPTGDTRNDYTMRVGGAGGKICAGLRNLEDVVLSGAACDSAPETLFTPSEGIDKAVRPADDHKISPDVLVGEAVTRKPIDHRYNCRADYPIYPAAGSEIWHPHFGPVDGCDDDFAGTNRDDIDDRSHMDQLGSHFRPGTTPTDWIGGAGDWMVRSGGDCTGDQVHDAQAANQHLFLDCDVVVNNGQVFEVDTEGYIVISGTLTIRGEFRVNQGDNEDVAMIVNGSGVVLDGFPSSDMTFNRTFAYFNEGTLDVRSDAFTWTAPIDEAYDDDNNFVNCLLTEVAGEDVPSPECFEDLALWSNNEGLHFMTGGGSLDIEGTFFAPNAGLSSDQWVMRGGTNQVLDGAQFFSYKFDVAGGSRIGLKPDPDRNTETFEPFVGLIR